MPFLRIRKTLAATIVAIFLFLLGCNAKPASNAAKSEPVDVQREVSAPGRANLQLVLEGPMAICLRPEKYPDRIQVFIPKATGHFEPGFDADSNETLLCEGEFSLDFAEANRRTMVQPKLEEPRDGPEWEKVGADCSQKKPGYLSILLEKPDRILPFHETRATISADGSSSSEGRYVSQTLLYYNNVLLSGMAVNRHSKTSCKVTVKLPSGITIKRNMDFSKPWTPKFYSLGTDVRLTLGMTPSELDDTKHHQARRSHDAITRMLGISDRRVFFRGRYLGPHNDCRAPQIVVQPLEAKQNDGAR